MTLVAYFKNIPCKSKHCLDLKAPSMMITNRATITIENMIRIVMLIFFCKTVKMTIRIIMANPAIITKLFIKLEKN